MYFEINQHDNIPENPGSPEDRWRVSASWVLDLDQYNEWMSEEDYEVDEKGGKKVHKLRLSVEELMPVGNDEKRVGKTGSTKQKRKRSPSPTPTKGPNKRKRYFYFIFLLFILLCFFDFVVSLKKKSHTKNLPPMTNHSKCYIYYFRSHPSPIPLND